MEAAVYILGSLTTLACAWLLLRAFGQSRKRLLLWSGLCFAVLTVSNVLRFLDLVVYPVEVDLYIWRLASAAVALLLLLVGLIWDGD